MEYQNFTGHTKGHINSLKKLHSEVKIYIPKELVNGKKRATVKKRWHVYYYYRNPFTNKMKKFINRKGINQLKTVTERKKYANALKSAVIRWLQDGYSPYGHISDKNEAIQNHYSVIDAINHAIEEKQKVWGESTKVNTLSKCKVFKDWIKIYGLENMDIKLLKKRHISEFLNYTTSPTGRNGSSRSRNNYRATVNSLLNQLVVDDILDFNFAQSIPKLATKPVKNKAFTKEQLNNIKKYLEKNDPYLLRYIQFIMYAFLRPIEVVRIKVGDINLNRKVLEVRTKTESNSTILIIDKLEKIINGMNVDFKKPNLNLFSNLEKPAKWVTGKEKGKADFFIRRFRFLKRELKFSDEYGLYSFRHTFTLDLYNSFLEQGLTQLEAKHRLMTITRHKSLSGLENYLRDIGAVLPKDYSNDYTIDF